MKGSQHPSNDVSLNPSGNESIREVIARTDLGRRTFIKTALSASVLAGIGGLSMNGIIRAVQAAPIPPADGFAGIGFESIPPSTAPVADRVEVPPGYRVQVLASWGDPIMPGGRNWTEGATQDAAAQARQFGMHNDGMHFFPLRSRIIRSRSGVTRGLLCVNHEYTHEDILHGSAGLDPMTLAKARKSQAAHGVSVVELRKVGENWTLERHSHFGRRITANTEMRVSGPAAGSDLLKSKRFRITDGASREIGVNNGYTAYGTHNNCAHGYTPWGTYLTCEENWNNYFAAPTGGAVIDEDQYDQKSEIIAGQSRYGIGTAAPFYRWPEVDPRFDADNNPLEPHLYGWVVEIDPFDPRSTPVKRTAMGRFKHESAQLAVSADADGTPNRVAYYMGDDERNEYIYKFVCARPFDPADRKANRDLLDEGTLYVARFTNEPGLAADTYRGAWIALAPDAETVIDDPASGGKLKLRDLPRFSGADDTEVQAKILVFTRQAADAVGATMMDRPEWTALRTYRDSQAPINGFPTYDASRPLEVYCTLTNNSRRGNGPVSSNQPDGSTNAGSANPPVDVANPRPDNDFGHIIRWREDGNLVTASGFEWDIFVLCGDAATTKTLGASYTPDNLVDGVPASGPVYEGTLVADPAGSADFGAPDGLWFDHFGRMWVQTDQQGDAEGDWVNIGSNCMVCADPSTKEVRRFLTSPPKCEVTGVVTTPDGTAMFVGIQHPGEDAPADDPTKYSNWPQSQFVRNSSGARLPNTPGLSRPRASVVVITREDGGIIGA
jgi:secreted PhoX family phosphatase